MDSLPNNSVFSIKRGLLYLLFAIVCASLSEIEAYSQDNHKDRNLFLEVSAQTQVFIPHSVNTLNTGVRFKDVVAGLGAGYGVETWNAYPASRHSIPMHLYGKGYIFFSERRRLFLFVEGQLGLQYFYKVNADEVYFQTGELQSPPYWRTYSCVCPGLGVNLWRNTNISVGLASLYREAQWSTGIKACLTICL